MKSQDPHTLLEEEIAMEKQKEVHQTEALSGLMKAVHIYQYGGVEKLVQDVAPIPKPAPDELLIKVHGAGVNPIDWKIREGYLKERMPERMPLILGWEVAGTVVHTGMLVSRFNEGDHVFARMDLLQNGGYAEYAIVKATDVAFAPKDIPLHMAAGVPLAAQTAWMGLFEIGNLKANQKILIHGGSGGVGTFAVQLAKIAGAHVIATTSAINIGLVKNLGADEVIDYQKEDFAKKVKDLNMVFDIIGGETQARSWQTLRQNGMLVSTVSVDETAAAKYGVTGKTFFANSNGARLQEIAELMDKHLLRIVVDKEFTIAEVKQAHELSQSGKARGKIILKILSNGNKNKEPFT